MNAALACAQLEQLQVMLDSKRELAGLYSKFFEEKGISFRTELPDTKVNYWLMCVELNDRLERDLFLKETNANGVMTRPIWQLMFRLPVFEKCQRDEQTNAQFLEERIVNIPSSVR
ncbi:DegT/DnrJ/EryC1/StrS aminotransferase family protein [compost metagenome]